MSSVAQPLRLVPLAGIPEVEPGADLAALVRTAAERAGIERQSFQRLMKKYGIRSESFRRSAPDS